MWEKEISYGQLTGEIFRRANTLFSGGNYGIGDFTAVSPFVQITKLSTLLQLILINQAPNEPRQCDRCKGPCTQSPAQLCLEETLCPEEAAQGRGCLVSCGNKGCSVLVT